MTNLARALLLAATAALLLHCGPVDDEELKLASVEAALDSVGPTLSSGKYTFLATVIGAENQVFAGGRLFITGDKGVYELRKNAAGTYDRITLAPEQTSPFCQFGGITEVKGTLYVNCYGVTQSFIFGAQLTSTPSFRAIYTLAGNGFANGLTSDDDGRLYVATTFQNQILRLVPSQENPFVIAQHEVYQKNSGGLTNGLAHHAGSIYWTDAAAIKRNTVDREFATFKQVMVDFAYFDDLHVDESGILATDAVNNVLRAYSLLGRPTGVSRQKFAGPSSVGRALGKAGFSQNALIVTERSGNKVSVFEPGL
jgi:sugar lactone lactonase YvrE